MKITPTTLPDVLIFEPTVHGDDRGYFMETWRLSRFREAGITLDVVQENQSKSVQGTLRGLHYQLQHPQGKLARVVSGEVFDVAVDLRRASPSFGQWFGLVLSGDNRKQLWIPPGFGHGFYVLSETAELVYKCTDYYHPEDDHSLCWDDPDIGIDWPLLETAPLLSEKDRNGARLRDARLYP